MINLFFIFKIISRNLLILTAAFLACIIVAIYYDENIMPFVFSSSISFFLGIILLLISFRNHNDNNLHIKEAYITVIISWFLLGLIGSLPYIYSKSIPSFVNAFFESVSGFTTTGSSILTDIEILPYSILFWRSLTHWIGGIGIIVLVIVIMPTLKIGSYNLFTMESSLQEKIKPKIKSIGRRLLLIYVLLTFLEVVFLLLGKMSLFESVCHSFGTIATGGFSPKNDSIASYSPYIQYIIMIFMLLAGTNFIIHFYLYTKNFKKIKENEELKFYLSVVFVIGIIITCSLIIFTNKSIEESFRESFFQVISIITCTGFATADYLQWPVFAWTIIFFAMFLGGSTGSTAGGIKMVRHLILFKNIRLMLKKAINPNAIFAIRLNHNTLPNKTNNSILTFISLYLIIFVIGTFLLVCMGIDLKSAGGSVATCMAGIGPGIGSVGPVSNFAHLPDLAKILLTFLMIIGRLEIYTVLVLFSRSFWKK